MRTEIERVVQAVQGMPWAILPSKLAQIEELLALRAAGVEFTAEEIEARIGAAPRRSAAPQASGGVAVLPLYGAISYRMNMLSSMSGGTSLEQFMGRFDAAVANPDIATIVVDADTPGGSVLGIPEAAQKIRDARAKKQVIVVANGMLASAGYWLGSQASKLVVTPSGEVGSIGVFAMHVDTSAADAKAGITRTIVKAGKFKAEGHPSGPLSEEARAYMQAQIDEFYGMFVDAVAAGRGISPDAVRNGYGQGRTVLAKSAIAEGMVDQVATLEEVLADLGISPTQLAAARGTPARATAEHIDAVQAGAGGAAPNDVPTPPTLEPAPGARSNTVADTTTAATPVAAPPIAQVGADHDAVARAAEVSALCGMHGIAGDRIATFIREGKTVGDVAQVLLAEARRASEANRVTPPPPPAGLADLPEKDRKRFSISNAIAQAAGIQKPGLEMEVSEYLDSKLPSGYSRGGGILVPTHGLDRVAAGDDTKTTGKGAELVFTEEGDFIDRLRNKAMVLQLGATFLPGLVGDYAEPRLDGDASAAWVGENPGADAGESELATGQVKLTPKQLIGSVPFSRLLFRQSNVNVEDRVRNSLTSVHALAIDKAGLHGTGASNDPKGAYSASGVNAVAFGGAITFGKVIDMESAIIADNADVGAMAYLVTPEVRGVAKQTRKDAGSGLFLYTGTAEQGEMNGYRAAATNQLLKNLGAGTNEHAIVFGVWSEMLVGEWGFLELIVDPLSMARRGMIRVTSYQAADIQFRHEEAFCKGTGLTLS